MIEHEKTLRDNFNNSILPKYNEKLFGDLSALKKFDTDKNKQIDEAILYALTSGGKRIRPVLTLETANVIGADKNYASVISYVIELIHTFSLIQDDMPCMDDDEYRRGKKTVHKVFGETTALLGSDYLLNYAYRLLSSEAIQNKHKNISAVLNHVATSAADMIEGQFLDIHYNADTIENMVVIHSKKTASMIKLCFVSVCESMGLKEVDEELYCAFKVLGQNIGLMFQIVDDIIDNREGKIEENNFAKKFSEEIAIKKLGENKALCDEQIKTIMNKNINTEFFEYFVNELNKKVNE